MRSVGGGKQAGEERGRGRECELGGGERESGRWPPPCLLSRPLPLFTSPCPFSRPLPPFTSAVALSLAGQARPFMFRDDGVLITRDLSQPLDSAFGGPFDRHVPDGHVSDSHVPDGHVLDSHVPDRHVPDSHVPGSHVLDGHVPDRHVPGVASLYAQGLCGAAPRARLVRAYASPACMITSARTVTSRRSRPVTS